MPAVQQAVHMCSLICVVCIPLSAGSPASCAHVLTYMCCMYSPECRLSSKLCTCADLSVLCSLAEKKGEEGDRSDNVHLQLSEEAVMGEELKEAHEYDTRSEVSSSSSESSSMSSMSSSSSESEHERGKSGELHD